MLSQNVPLGHKDYFWAKCNWEKANTGKPLCPPQPWPAVKQGVNFPCEGASSPIPGREGQPLAPATWVHKTKPYWIFFVFHAFRPTLNLLRTYHFRNPRPLFLCLVIYSMMCRPLSNGWAPTLNHFFWVFIFMKASVCIKIKTIIADKFVFLFSC